MGSGRTRSAPRRAAGRPRQPRKHPEVQFMTRKPPLSGHLAAGDRAGGNQFVELALPKPDIVGQPRWRSGSPFLHLYSYIRSCSIYGQSWDSCRTRPVENAMSDQLGAWQLILTGDANLFAIVRLSLAVSLSAVALAAIAGLPLGALLALTRFPGRSALVVLLNALMGLPPVVVGLAVYLLLSRSG